MPIYNFASVRNLPQFFSGWKWYHYLLAILLLVYLISCSRGGDFMLFWDSALRFRNRQNLYYPYYDGIIFYYGPVFSMLLSPFTYLPFELVKFTWVCLNVYFLYALWQIITNHLETDALSKKQYRILAWMAFLFLVHFINLNLKAGQMTVFMLFVCLKSVELARTQKPYWVAVLLGLGIAVKTIPLVIIAYLLYRGYFKAAIGAIIFSILFIFSPCLFSSVDYGVKQVIDWISVFSVSDGAYIYREFSRPQHSIHSLFVGLLADSNHDFPYRRNILFLTYDEIRMYANSAVACFVLFTLWFLRTWPFKEIQNKQRQLWEIAYICLIVPMIFPMQQKYSYFFIFPAITYCIFYVLKNQTLMTPFLNKTIITLLALTFILSSLSTIDILVGEYFKNMAEYYKLITFGALFLMGVLALCKPDFSNTITENEALKQ